MNLRSQILADAEKLINEMNGQYIGEVRLSVRFGRGRDGGHDGGS
jgi:hypothetical protein